MVGGMRGRLAVVTGASRGLGRAIAADLVSHGARVGLLARPGDRLDAAVAELGEGALALPCDIQSPDQVRAAFDVVARKLGGLDILVNNAATCLVNAFDTVPDDDVRTEIGTNLFGTIWCTRAALPLLRQSAAADIVNLSSEAARAPFPHLSIYAATKAAIEALGDGLREELRGTAIRVMTVRAGNMDTDIASQWGAEQRDAYLKLFLGSDLARKVGAPVPAADVARAIVNALLAPPNVSARLIEIGPR